MTEFTFNLCSACGTWFLCLFFIALTIDFRTLLSWVCLIAGVGESAWYKKSYAFQWTTSRGWKGDHYCCSNAKWQSLWTALPQNWQASGKDGVENIWIHDHIPEFMSLIIELKIWMRHSQVCNKQWCCFICPSYKHFRETLIYEHGQLVIDEDKFSLSSHEKMDHDNSGHDDLAVGFSSFKRGKSRTNCWHRKGKCQLQERMALKAECLSLKEKNDQVQVIGVLLKVLNMFSLNQPV